MQEVIKRPEYIERGSGNIFADLGSPDAEEKFAKAELARKIGQIIAKQRLTQKKAAELLGVDQPKISALLRGQLSGFSLERLMRFLTTLGRDVQIVVKAKPRGRGHATLSVA